VLSFSLRRATSAAAAALTLALGACGSKNSPPTEPSGPPVQSTTVTITASGASPKNVQVNIGERVLFINNDNRAHNMTSDPHPEHNDCPDLNVVGLLQPGQRRETQNLVQPRVCGFHDHDLPNVANLQGSITIR
jgi:plastocyanin